MYTKCPTQINKASLAIKLLLVTTLLLLGTTIFLGYKYFNPETTSKTATTQEEVQDNTKQRLPSKESVADSTTKGLKEFKSQFGYKIYYPTKFEQRVEPAYVNSDLILYSGGQSYDLVIQVWDNKNELTKQYKDDPYSLNRMVIKEVNGKTISMLNQNDSDQVKEIMDSFEVLK